MGIYRETNEVGDVLINVRPFHFNRLDGLSRSISLGGVVVLSSELVDELIPSILVIVDSVRANPI